MVDRNTIDITPVWCIGMQRLPGVKTMQGNNFATGDYFRCHCYKFKYNLLIHIF